MLRVFSSPLFKVKSAAEKENRLVILQCDLGNVDGDLIACARYRIYDLTAKADEEQTTHVLFIIHLSHRAVSSTFVGFQGDPWMSSHIDDLNTTTDNTVSASDAIGLSISELFRGVSYIRDAVHGHTDDVEFLSSGSENGDDEASWGIDVKKEQNVEVQTAPPSMIVEDIEAEDLFIEEEGKTLLLCWFS